MSFIDNNLSIKGRNYTESQDELQISTPVEKKLDDIQCSAEDEDWRNNNLSTFVQLFCDGKHQGP